MIIERNISVTEGNQISEAQFTEFLCRNLDLIEDGLVLIDREVRIKDSGGASGRVDIIARDRYQNTVVIEVKCSDKAAREAAHEIFKYSEILRSQLGLSDAEFRCILVSTHWRELLRAFTDYSLRHHDVAGYVASKAGSSSWTLAPIKTLERKISVSLTSAQTLYLYGRPDNRESDYVNISRYLAEWGAPSSVGFLIENISDERVMYPYGLYIILGTADPDWKQSRLAQESLSEYPFSEDDYAFDPAENYIESHRLGDNHASDIEIGSPEKIRHALSLDGGWELTKILRSGAFSKRASIDDDALLAQAAQDMRGFTNTQFLRLSSPSRRAHWSQSRLLIRSALPATQTWLPQVEQWLDEAEKCYAGYDVQFGVVNQGIIRPLMYLPLSEFDYSPMMITIMIVDRETGARIRGLRVELRWDGRRRRQKLLDVLEDATGNLFFWLLTYADPEFEVAVLKRIGLGLHVYEIDAFEDGLTPRYRLMTKKGETIRADYDNIAYHGNGMISFEWRSSVRIDKFIEKHREAIQELRAETKHLRIGMPGQE